MEKMMPVVKTCKKHDTEYVLHSGVMRCPQCVRDKYKKYDSQHATQRKRWRQSQAGKESHRKYRQSNNGKITAQKAQKRRTEENCDIRHNKKCARRAVAIAIKAGNIIKSSICSLCGRSSNIESHHHLGYDKEHWLDIQWLCRDCHHSTHEKNQI